METKGVVLRPVAESDLPTFFDHQRDPEALRMAAFTARERPDFMAHWKRILGDSSVTARTILAGGEIVGNVVCFERRARRLVGYWLGREFWGGGIATLALRAFLAEVGARPLYAYVATHNVGSIRVLEKCGFSLATGEAGVVAPVGKGRVEECLYVLAD